nr:hypothetical protein [Paenibacillus mucilaginosus]
MHVSPRAGRRSVRADRGRGGELRMSLVVLEAGLLTTVQDLGRIGSRSSGVVSSGAADPAALRTANVLIGNEPWAAGLELTLTGGVLRFEQDVVVALCGAAMDARAEGGPPGAAASARRRRDALGGGRARHGAGAGRRAADRAARRCADHRRLSAHRPDRGGGPAAARPGEGGDAGTLRGDPAGGGTGAVPAAGAGIPPAGGGGAG